MSAEVKSMEIKKTQTATKEKSYSFKKGREFVDDVKNEVLKVNWTSKEELKTYTKIVVIATFVFGMAIYFLDLVIQSSLSFLSWIGG
ncbi:MAG: preprotein translocase subunit SecE [Parachlamydia sp.]|jgi:preprotein translocase subunit SecE|nr:preprotein translocase subunit SecE [Parachlamydia sp.]